LRAQSFDPRGRARAIRISSCQSLLGHRVLEYIGGISGEGVHAHQQFRQIRTRLLNGVTVALEGVAAGSTHGNSREARSVAGVLTSMLSHVAAHRRGLEDWGIAPGDLRATMARIVADVLIGPI